MSTQAQKFLQKLANSSSFDINVSNFKPNNTNNSFTSPPSSSSSSPSSSSTSNLSQQHQQQNYLDNNKNLEYDLRLAVQEKKFLEEELRKTKVNLDAVVSEIVLSENEVFNN